MSQGGLSDISFSQGARLMFYLVTPNETSFSHVDEVPQYVQKATPFFIGLILVELLVGWLKRGHLIVKIHDVTTSVSAGMMSRLPQLFMRGIEISSYVYIWNNYHIVELPWDSAWTWWIGMLGVDFGYYWVHRFSHELNILWAAHQVHHSSEYYNLSTALRQSLLQQFSSWIFYLPMALAVPPSVFAVHIQFNLLYQFWIHTEMVRDLGPLEWVLNTPSHHRVHHGRNKYCIDKNYGGALIIWDRLFGTFAPEGNKVIYGLVHPIKKSDIMHVQFHHYRYIWRKFWRTKGIAHKLSVIFKGPSWAPGKPRLGDHADVPVLTGKELPHDPRLPLFMDIYVFAQFLLLLHVYNDLFVTKAVLSQVTMLIMTSFVLLSLTSLGYIIDKRSNSAKLEMLRCLLMMLFYRAGYIRPSGYPLSLITEAFISLSAGYWGLQFFSQLAHHNKKGQ
ncbi:alkylglycerol monooxygenase [Chanos chanos]|uniref:Alkylglycerol monooxygenase n=1 Tax=Chanos chanos TaxID=29144 RepID=A0A6J2VZI0_CHACN|nr:alkylglycerol monooxygenase [Chanos chanos]